MTDDEAGPEQPESMPTPGIQRNAARCLFCGDVIESRWRHEMVTCSCGALSVDGGHAYFRRLYTDSWAYEDLSICNHEYREGRCYYCGGRER